MSIRELTTKEQDLIDKGTHFECSWCRESGECDRVHETVEIAGYDDDLVGPVCIDCAAASEPA